MIDLIIALYVSIKDIGFSQIYTPEALLGLRLVNKQGLLKCPQFSSFLYAYKTPVIIFKIRLKFFQMCCLICRLVV